MWKPENRRTAASKGFRYPNDLSDAKWALIGPLIPPAKRGDRQREIDVREFLNAIFYVLFIGCRWRGVAQRPVAEERGAQLLYAVGVPS